MSEISFCIIFFSSTQNNGVIICESYFFIVYISRCSCDLYVHVIKPSNIKKYVICVSV